MINQFQVSPELQQFLQGIGSKALVNVVWDTSFSAADLPTLPTNPGTVRRSLMFDKITTTVGATPSQEYNAFLQNTDGSSLQQVTFRRAP